MRNASVKKPVSAITRNVIEDDGVLGLGLDADAVRPLDVAAADRPHDPGGEDDAAEVGRERVPLVDAAVEELEVVGQLVVDLEHDGRDEQPHEPEVDERVHDPGRGVAEQGLHPHAGAEVAHAPVEVLLGGAPVVGRAALVVADPQAHQPRADEQHRGRGHVERPVDRVGHVDERLPRDARVIAPLGEPGHVPRDEREDGDQRADDEDELVRLGPLESTHGVNLPRRGRPSPNYWTVFRSS